MNTDEALIKVLARNIFYRRLYFLALGLLGLVVVIIGILIGLFVYLLDNPEPPLYFATDAVGELIPIQPVTAPFPINDVMSWTINAVNAAYAYDYVNYRAQLQDAQKYFTPYGWYNYMRALQTSNNLVALTQRKQLVKIQLVGQPTVLKAGLLSGAYAWQLQMPMLVSYWEPPYDKASYSNALVVRVIVQRQPVLQSNAGLGVVQLIATFATANNAPQQLSVTPTA